MNNVMTSDNRKTEFDTGAHERLAKIEANSFWFCARNRLIIWALSHYFPKAKNFMEIGCGNGFVLSEIEKKMNYERITGSDLYAEGLACAKKRLRRAKVFQMDIREIALSEAIDLVGAFDVLEHIDNDEGLLNKIYSVLNPGGGIIITVPQHEFLWSYTDELSAHVRRYNSNELRKKIEKAGFKIKDMVSFVSFLMPLVIMRRLVKNTEQKMDKVILDLRLPRGINWVFEKVLDFELFLIRIGIRMSFGASLLVVAYK